MGEFSIPEPAVGSLRVHMKVDQSELRSLIDLLSKLTGEVAKRGGLSSCMNGSTPHAGASTMQPAATMPQPAPTAQRTATAALRPSAASAPVPLPPAASARAAMPPPAATAPRPQLQQQGVPSRPLIAPGAPPPFAAPPFPTPRAAPPAAPAPVPLPAPPPPHLHTWQQPPPPPPPPPPALPGAMQQPPALLAQHQTAHVPEEAPAAPWALVDASDRADHGASAVHALSYAATLPGLPGGDGHGGWLISTSRCMLNLWECSTGGRGAPGLTLMHTQECDVTPTALAAEPALGVLLGASVDARGGGGVSAECVSVHSLSAEAGMLAYKYRFAPPRVPPRTTPHERLITQVASLHPLGGSVSSCCVCSFADRLVVFELSPSTRPGTTITKTRISWVAAGQARVTALAVAPLLRGLLAAASSGPVTLWRPNEWQSGHPSLVLGGAHNGHDGAVTSVTEVNDEVVATAGLDGKVLLWDPRQPSSPFGSASLGAPVMRMAASPFCDCLAVSTGSALFTVDLMEYSGAVAPINTRALSTPAGALTWNTQTGELYTAGQDGTVSIWQRRGW